MAPFAAYSNSSGEVYRGKETGLNLLNFLSTSEILKIYFLDHTGRST